MRLYLRRGMRKDNNMKDQYRAFYQDLLRLHVGREEALNLVLVQMGLKDATTVGFDNELSKLLKKKGFKFELDESFLEKSIYGLVEYTTNVPLPGAQIIKRLYASKRYSHDRLKKLRSGSSFDQGLAFGFPMCDMLNYCRKEKKEGKHYIEILQDWLKLIPCVEGVKHLDYRLMGALLKYSSSIRVIVHIPCEANCGASLELAERNLRVLESLEPEFKNFVVKEFKKPLLLYGNKWEDIRMLQFSEIKKQGAYFYTGKCSFSLPAIITKGEVLKIKLTPNRKVEIYCGSKKIIESESKKALPWSYTFIFPYESAFVKPQGHRKVL